MDPVLVQTLVTIGSFLILGTVYIVNGRTIANVLEVRLQMIDEQMEDFKSEIKKLSEVIIAQALQASRMEILDERLVALAQRVANLDTEATRMRNEIRGRS